MIPGKVYLVGAGPGDPELLTLKAMKILKKADVILYDRLANPEILSHAKQGARLVFVGKEPGHHIIDQAAINKIIATEVSVNKVVVRLKGGDPFVLGRGGEEAETLRSMGINFEVVPGVTSALAVPEAAGVPITDRRVSSSFTVVSGHSAKNKSGPEIDFSKIDADTVIVLMGLGNLERIVEQFLKKRHVGTPVAVIQQGTTKNEKVVIGRLNNIVERVEVAGVQPPTIIVIGEVVNLREGIAGPSLDKIGKKEG